jgi:ribosomal protein S18 acetylase RimI-like enzyme
LMQQLKQELQRHKVMRIDVAVHVDNPEARGFYKKLGFTALNEERLACLI